MREKENFTLAYAEQAEPRSYIKLTRELLSQRYPTPPLAFVHSYGCQQSVSDGEKYKGLLAELGYGFTTDKDEADLALYNTCAVRENAEQRVFGHLGELAHSKNRRPDMVIGLAGCMTEQPHVAEKLRKSYPQVDLVLGTNAFLRLPRLLYEKLAYNKRTLEVTESERSLPIAEGLPVRRDSGIKAWVPVMYGCDNFCSYCIVPYVRGRERSRESGAVLEEIAGLVNEGRKEITLLGQNVNSYGKGRSGELNFAELLRRINDIPGDFIIRFMTSHPKDCTRELLDAMADCPKVAKHLHLPVQSGSNRVLGEMNRRYTAERYLELADYAKARMPELSLTSDIIVGFPGETYEDFTQTLELVKQVGYTSLFTFLYSRRSGTRAESFPDPVPESEKSAWLRELLRVQSGIGERILHGYVGKVLRVLTEAQGRDGGGILTARTQGNVLVELRGGRERVGQFTTVKITAATNCILIGEPCTTGTTNL